MDRECYYVFLIQDFFNQYILSIFLYIYIITQSHKRVCIYEYNTYV